MEKRAEPIQVKVWLITAVGTLLALTAPESGILTNLILGLLAALICMCTDKLCSGGEWGKWMYCIQWLWSNVMLLYFLKDAAMIWGRREDLAVPVVLLLLALWSAKSEFGRNAAVGSVMIWFVAALLGGIAAASVENVHWSWTVKAATDFEANLLPVYLLPAVMFVLPQTRDKKGFKWYLLLPIIGVALCCVVRGTAPVIKQGELGFIELSKSVELFGKVLRLEAVAAMGLTLGLYCVISVLASLCAVCVEKVNSDIKGPALIISGLTIIVGLLGKITITGVAAGIGCIICWVILPLLAQFVVQRKKS